ncbi:MAG: SAM-dependent methyltransferase [Deltaproteobacteria bacterium]|nr:SAM-dependent methyltransferase [Deltaproteobacteria bacterium]
MPEHAVTPEWLMRVTGQYWEACVLHAAVRLDVFTGLGDGVSTARELAGRLGLSERGAEGLLNALSAMGLLVKEGEAFRNAPGSLAYLSSTSPEYMGYLIGHHQNLIASWSRLHEAVRTGEPVPSNSSIPEEERRRNFLLGMFNSGSMFGPMISKMVDLRGRKTLLDLGGGPGTYAVHFCLQNPDLRATVFDLPTTEPFARGVIERYGLSGRIAFQGGNYLKDPVPGDYDVVWTSHNLHSEGPEGCRTILRKAVGALRPGGLLLIHEFYLEESKDRPLFPALFSLNMLVNTREGRSYAEDEIRAMLEELGVREIRRLPSYGPSEAGILAGSG